MPFCRESVSGVILDISGVLYDTGPSGGVAIPGSVIAVRRLREAGIPLRFCTNSTETPRKTLVGNLRALGFEIEEKEVFSPAPAVCRYLNQRGLKRPHFLIHPRLMEDFAEVLTWRDDGACDCVILGDAADELSYANLNRAFQILMEMETPVLISMGMGKYYKETDGLKLDVGAFARLFQFACDVEPVVVGKPAAEFFKAPAIDILGSTEASTKSSPASLAGLVMVGDDLKSDVGGAQATGMKAVLVRTGKYRKENETDPDVKPDAIVDDLRALVDELLGS